MCGQYAGLYPPDTTICIAMIMREIDAARRPFGVGGNSGLPLSWAGPSAWTDDALGTSRQSATKAATTNLTPWAGGAGVGASCVCTPVKDATFGQRLVNVTMFSQKIVKGMDVSALVYDRLDRRNRSRASANSTADPVQEDGRQCRVKGTNKF